jgi:hypothetical protein
MGRPESTAFLETDVFHGVVIARGVNRHPLGYGGVDPLVEDRHHPVAVFDRQRSTGAEIVLHVDHKQGISGSEAVTDIHRQLLFFLCRNVSSGFSGLFSPKGNHKIQLYKMLTWEVFMIGAIAGDIIGSVHEHAGTKTKDFPLFATNSRFTDDTVLTVAVAAKLLNGGDYVDNFHEYFHAYPGAGYGGSFTHWAILRNRSPYNSWGNGAAMRVSPVGFACESLDAVMEEARRSAEVTHNHPEGIRGACSANRLIRSA